MKGNLHPITQFMRQSLKYFTDLGFQIKEGNEIESEWYNFDALNVPTDHPSRDVQDTFWLQTNPAEARRAKGGGEVLRTHTTGTESQIIKEEKIKPPFKIIVPGRCYRNERTDATHEHTFYQIDGIVVDRNVNMSHLIGILSDWMKSIYGQEIKIRTVPSYFPFVEPGLEMHIQLKDGKWMEMLGAGMGHPVVLKNMGLDPEKPGRRSLGEGGWQAAMWGPGIDRFAMLKYGINDIRKFHSQDLRFLKQF